MSWLRHCITLFLILGLTSGCLDREQQSREQIDEPARSGNADGYAGIIRSVYAVTELEVCRLDPSLPASITRIDFYDDGSAAFHEPCEDRTTEIADAGSLDSLSTHVYGHGAHIYEPHESTPVLNSDLSYPVGWCTSVGDLDGMKSGVVLKKRFGLAEFTAATFTYNIDTGEVVLSEFVRVDYVKQDGQITVTGPDYVVRTTPIPGQDIFPGTADYLGQTYQLNCRAPL